MGIKCGNLYSKAKTVFWVKNSKKIEVKQHVGQYYDQIRSGKPHITENEYEKAFESGYMYEIDESDLLSKIDELLSTLDKILED